MTPADPLAQARTLLKELVDGARAGTLIPVRLAAQLEAVDALLKQAQESPAAAPAPATDAHPDTADLLREQALFVSHAVHELRNPLTSVRGYADMLGNPALGQLTDMQKQFAETIRTNSRRMEGLLTDVSDTAKIRGGTLKLSTKMDTFKNIALMIEKATRPQAEAQGKTLTFDIPSGLPILTTDGEMLAKAFTKLVENALRYTPADGGEVTVSAAADGDLLTVRVRDNGIGMTTEEVAQLGTVYFRSENEAVRAHKGSGLGIPVAYGIFRLLGAQVSVESASGVGTTFTVQLKGMT
jgi:signal transduction histidine kinase